MKHVWKIILLVLLFMLFVSCTTQQGITQKGDKPVTLEEQAQAIADIMVNDYQAASVQYELIDRGTIVLSGSSGVFDRASNRSVTKDDMYGIGSTSKMFTIAATMLLWDQGKVDLDASLTTYIPSFSMADERYKDITVRMLMNHSSGLNGSTLGNSFLFDDNRTLAHDTLLANLSTQRLKADPGFFSEYCNDGFTLLEIMVENISGISFSDFIAQHFSQPLGLKNTKTPRDEFDKDSRIARLYHPLYDGALPTETVNVLGTGGLYSTAQDLCTFSQVLMGTKTDILSLEAAEMMMAEEYKRGMWIDHTGDNFFAFGLGWDTIHGYPFSNHGLQALFKGGDTMLFHSALIVIPSLELGVAVTSSGGASILNYILGATILEQHLLQKGYIDHIYETPQSQLKPNPSAMPAQYATYSGLYGDADSIIEVAIEDGILSMKPQGAEEALRYLYVKDNLFQAEDGNNTLMLSLQSDGNIYIQSNTIIDIPKLGSVPFFSFTHQKLENNTLEPSLYAVWSTREGKAYYMVNEVATAQQYFLNNSLKLSDYMSSGYAMGGAKIIEEQLAVNTLKFRDVGDLHFTMIEEKEYLFINDMVYIREDFIPPLSSVTNHCVIGQNGFAKYFSIDEQMQGKTMVVTVPEGASFAVYDKEGNCINFSIVSKNNTTILPEEGKIVFVGQSGDRFELSFI